MIRFRTTITLDYRLINIIDLYNFKIIKTTSLPFGDKFYIETPIKYIKLRIWF